MYVQKNSFYFDDLNKIMKFSMSKNRPYFLENKEWYCVTEFASAYCFNLTKFGKSNPKVLKSYMDFYNIKNEKVFEHATDYNSDTEYRLWSKDTITKKMKEKGATHSEIKEAVDLWLNIDEIMAKEKNKKD